MRPVTVVCGHYGSGKTNLSINLAMDLSCDGRSVSLIDLDIVNPYFRASEQRGLLEKAGVRLIAPVFSEAKTGLDVPSLTGAIAPALQDADEENVVIVDLGGDDVGAASLGRFSSTVSQKDHCMLYVLNRHRNLMADPAEAVGNLREIEAATRLSATGLVDNAHMKDETDQDVIMDAFGYAQGIGKDTDLPLVGKTVPKELVSKGCLDIDALGIASMIYPVEIYVKNPWE